MHKAEKTQKCNIVCMEEWTKILQQMSLSLLDLTSLESLSCYVPVLWLISHLLLSGSFDTSKNLAKDKKSEGLYERSE